MTKLMHYPPRLSALFLPILLTACAQSSEVVAPQLPEPRPALKDCVGKPIPPIPGDTGSPITLKDAIKALADQRAAALDKARCASDFDSWYGDLRKGLATK